MLPGHAATIEQTRYSLHEERVTLGYPLYCFASWTLPAAVILWPRSIELSLPKAGGLDFDGTVKRLKALITMRRQFLTSESQLFVL